MMLLLTCGKQRWGPLGTNICQHVGKWTSLPLIPLASEEGAAAVCSHNSNSSWPWSDAEWDLLGCQGVTIVYFRCIIYM